MFKHQSCLLFCFCFFGSCGVESSFLLHLFTEFFAYISCTLLCNNGTFILYFVDTEKLFISFGVSNPPVTIRNRRNQPCPSCCGVFASSDENDVNQMYRQWRTVFSFGKSGTFSFVFLRIFCVINISFMSVEITKLIYFGTSTLREWTYR